ncbi:oligosaccharide flippase family protein [Membranihabitans maritimus]|uniref:oligosaccharide flippase family protein n=1 Tax=Membranihabitans maritimus TaxID=2904244 RepID=UPI001F016102|nr:oligosaccharide flippase family protein [Membranihabitans maritimus]
MARLRGSQLIKDSFWSLIGNAVARGLSLLAGIFIARFLGKDIFGEYGLIKSTILTIGVFSSFGLGFTSTKFVADYKREAPENIKLFIRYSTKITLIFSGVTSLLLFITASYVATIIFEAQSLIVPLRFLAILIVFNAITTTQIGILSGLGEFKTLAKINGFIGVLTFFLSVMLTYIWNFQGALIALLLLQILNCVLNFIAVRKNIPLSAIPILEDKNLQNRILKFSTPIALQAAVYNITSWTGSVLLVRFANFGELGMYNAAMQWNAIILFIPGIMRNVVLSHLSSNSHKQEEHGKVLNHTIIINILATLFPSIIVVIISPFIATFYGNTFEGLSFLIILAVSSTIFMSINNVYSQAFTSINKNWEMFILRFFRDTGVLFGFVLLMKNFKINGMYSLLTSKLIVSILFLLFVNRYYSYLIRRDKYST